MTGGNKIRCIDVSNSGKYIITTHRNNEIFLWNIDGVLLKQINSFPMEERIHRILFSPDENSVLIKSRRTLHVDIDENLPEITKDLRMLNNKFQSSLSVVNLAEDKMYEIYKVVGMANIVYTIHPTKNVFYWHTSDSRNKEANRNILVCDFKGNHIKKISVKKIGFIERIFPYRGDEICFQTREIDGGLALVYPNGKFWKYFSPRFRKGQKYDSYKFYDYGQKVLIISNKNIWTENMFLSDLNAREIDNNSTNIREAILMPSLNLVLTYDRFKIKLTDLSDPRIEKQLFAEYKKEKLFDKMTTQNYDIDDEDIEVLSNYFTFSPNHKHMILLERDSSKPRVSFRTTFTHVTISKTYAPYPITAQFLAHQDGIEELIVSPNNMYIATRSSDSIKVWTYSGELIQTLKDDDSVFTTFKFTSSINTKIITGSKDGTIKYWHLDGEELKRIQAHNQEITDVSFSKNFEYFITGSLDKMAIMWDAKWNPLDTIYHAEDVNYVDVSKENKQILVGGRDEVRVFDFEGNHWQTITPSEHKSLAKCSFSRSGNFIRVKETLGDVIIYKTWNEIIRSSILPFTENELAEFQILN